MRVTPKTKWFAVLLSGIVLAGCVSAPTTEPFELTIAHINDHHSHLLPMQRTPIMVNGEPYQVETGGFARVAAQIEAIRAQHNHVLALHAGDAVTGTLFYTLFGGVADAEMMNVVCFDAFALGNHEFDNGDAGLKRFLDALAMGSCDTPVLAANVQPEVGVSPLTPKTAWDSFQPYAVYQLGAEKVGVIGLDIAMKTKNSSQPDATTMFADEYETALHYINELRGLGIEKIGLLTHIQYRNDLELAERLPAVDFIIGGDSHTLLGDFSRFGLPSVGPYPMQVTNADGKPVCIGHAWQYSQVVGELHIQFQGDAVTRCGGTAHVLVSTDAPEAIQQLPQFSAIEEHPEVVAKLQHYQTQLDEMTQQVIAHVDKRLCMQRMGPSVIEECGRGRHSDAHRVVAEAFLASSPQADFALQNGGGVRRDIAAGPLSIADAYGLLPFSNTLVEIQITGAELRQVIEQALDYALSAGGSDGAYPHGANIRFAVDMTAGTGHRVTQLDVWMNDQWRAVDDLNMYTMITNSFLAAGNDGWHLLSELSAQGRAVNTYVDYAQAFVDWARQQGTISRPAEHSTIQFKAYTE